MYYPKRYSFGAIRQNWLLTGASPITIEELVSRYRGIKEKVSTGQILEMDLIMMESSIIRLCKELNFEDVYFRRIDYRSMGIRRFSDSPVDKNSVIENYPVRRKMSGSDSKGKTE